MSGQFIFEGLEEFFNAHGNRNIVIVSGQGLKVEIGGSIDALDCALWLAWVDRLPEYPEGLDLDKLIGGTA